VNNTDSLGLIVVLPQEEKDRQEILRLLKRFVRGELKAVEVKTKYGVQYHLAREASQNDEDIEQWVDAMIRPSRDVTCEGQLHEDLPLYISFRHVPNITTDLRQRTQGLERTMTVFSAGMFLPEGLTSGEVYLEHEAFGTYKVKGTGGLLGIFYEQESYTKEQILAHEFLGRAYALWIGEEGSWSRHTKGPLKDRLDENAVNRANRAFERMARPLRGPYDDL
jgi:hypothetical protein